MQKHKKQQNDAEQMQASEHMITKVKERTSRTAHKHAEADRARQQHVEASIDRPTYLQASRDTQKHAESLRSTSNQAETSNHRHIQLATLRMARSKQR